MLHEKRNPLALPALEKKHIEILENIRRNMESILKSHQSICRTLERCSQKLDQKPNRNFDDMPDDIKALIKGRYKD